MREALGSLFSGEGHLCELAADAASALALVEPADLRRGRQRHPMDGMDGLELLDRIKPDHPALPVVLVTAAGGVHQAVDAIKRGAFGYAVKPCDVGELQAMVAERARRPAAPRRERARRARPAVEGVGDMALVGHGAGHARPADGDRLRRPVERAGAHHRRDRRGQGARRARDSRPQRPRAAPVRGRQHVRHPAGAARGRDLRARARAASRAPSRPARGCSPRPTAGRSCSTRSATCPSACRRSSCASCSSATCAPSAAIACTTSTSA